MEATISSEHKTREEIVAEVAAAPVEEKPKRGGRRRQSPRDKLDAMLQVEAPTAASAATEAGAEAILVAAQIEPGPQLPGEIADDDLEGRGQKAVGRKQKAVGSVEQAPAPKRGSSRRKTTAQAATEEQQASAAQLSPTAEAPTQEAEEAPAKGKAKRGTRKKTTATSDETTQSKTQNSKLKTQNFPEPPKTGVEIIEVEDRNGVNYHTMQDLRNNQKVHNVTRKSARRLWHYAIVQHAHGAPDLSEALWHPEAPIGLWRQSSRAGATRYDLVSRQPDGGLRIFYGVTDDGLHAEWLELLRQAQEAGYEGPEPAEGQ